MTRRMVIKIITKTKFEEIKAEQEKDKHYE